MGLIYTALTTVLPLLKVFLIIWFFAAIIGAIVNSKGKEGGGKPWAATAKTPDKPDKKPKPSDDGSGGSGGGDGGDGGSGKDDEPTPKVKSAVGEAISALGKIRVLKDTLTELSLSTFAKWYIHHPKKLRIDKIPEMIGTLVGVEKLLGESKWKDSHPEDYARFHGMLQDNGRKIHRFMTYEKEKKGAVNLFRKIEAQLSAAGISFPLEILIEKIRISESIEPVFKEISAKATAETVPVIKEVLDRNAKRLLWLVGYFEKAQGQLIKTYEGIDQMRIILKKVLKTMK